MALGAISSPYTNTRNRTFEPTTSDSCFMNSPFPPEQQKRGQISLSSLLLNSYFLFLTKL